MHRLILCLLTGLTIVFLPQHLLAEDPAGPPGPTNAQPAGPNPEVLFNRLDTNHDGFVTQDELPPGMPEMFKQLLLLADANSDGKITKEELTAALNQHKQRADHDVKTDSQLNIMFLHNADAAETAKIIDQVFNNRKDEKLSITVDARLNALIVNAPQTLFGKIDALVKELDVKTPDTNSPPIGPRFRGPGAQAGQMPGPPFGSGFGRSEGRPDEMAGPPFGRQGMGPGRMGGRGGRPDQMAGPPSRGPGEDQPQKTAGADGPEGLVRVEAYTVTKADPQTTLKVLQTLLAGKPDVRMDIEPKTNHLIVLARPAEHATIQATLAQLQRDTQGDANAKDNPADMAGPPFSGPGGGRGRMGGPGFNGPGRGPGWMAGQGFGGRGMGHGWMGGQGFGGPSKGPAGIGGPPFGRGGPDGRSPQMEGRNFPGPNAGPTWMGGSHFNGPEQQPWAGPGYGPQHRWAAFEPMQQRPWQQYGHWGPPNRLWQANFGGPSHHRMAHWMAPGMAYGPGQHRPWQPNGQKWYQQLLSYNARPHHPRMAYGTGPNRPWQQYGPWGRQNRPWQANFGRPNHHRMTPGMSPGMAYGPGQHRTWQPNGQNWYQQLMSYNDRPPRQQFNPKALFDRLDTNHDNQLSFEEFSQAMKHFLHAVLPGPGPQWARPVGRFGGQGFGPPGHLAMANYPGSRPEAIEEKITMLFQNFDKKHDGQLTKDEAPPMIQKNFDRIDVDKKGFITPRDLYRAFSHLRHRAEGQKPVNQGDEKILEKPQAKDKPE
jgi:Ca2+-binding EF-hand superfamily protein